MLTPHKGVLQALNKDFYRFIIPRHHNNEKKPLLIQKYYANTSHFNIKKNVVGRLY